MLEIRQLTKTFAARSGAEPVAALRGISLNVAAGEFFALLGPSGCGKTTLLQSIAGLETPDDGSIEIAGVSVLDQRSGLQVPANRRGIGMVFQSYAIWPHMSVFENVAFPLVHGRDHGRGGDVRKRVLEALALVKLADHADRPAPHLSGGQQQRVALARAIVNQPRLILLDEPLSNLDAKLRVQVRSEIKRFHQDLQATVIYVTHDQLEALTMADKMAVMNGGLLQQYDTPANIFAKPANTFVASFVGSPAMSLIPLEMAEEGGTVVLRGKGDVALPLSADNAVRARRSSTSAVILGARHSTLSLHKEATPGSLPARVYTVEPTGDITYVQAYVGDSIVVVSVPPEVMVKPDERVWIGVDQERMHLFDGATQMALTAYPAVGSMKRKSYLPSPSVSSRYFTRLPGFQLPSMPLGLRTIIERRISCCWTFVRPLPCSTTS